MKLAVVILSAAAVATSLVACGGKRAEPPGREASGSATTARSLPEASGPVLKISGDHPYSVQGVSRGSAPIWGSSPAPDAHRHVLVLTEVRGKHADRPTPAPEGVSVHLRYLCEDSQTGCREYVERTEEFATKAQMTDPAYRPARVIEGETQMLEPGTAYYTTLYAPIPDNVAISKIKMCVTHSFSEPGQCMKLGILPEGAWAR